MNLSIIGLVLNFVGTILLAFSFVASENVGTHTDNKGKTTNFVLPNFRKILFRVGVGLVAAGFLLQLLAQEAVCLWIEAFFRFAKNS